MSTFFYVESETSANRPKIELKLKSEKNTTNEYLLYCSFIIYK